MITVYKDKTIQNDELISDLSEFRGNENEHIATKYHLDCKGHVYDTYPQIEEEGYLFRTWLFEGEVQGEKFLAMYWDEGNQWLKFDGFANSLEMVQQHIEDLKSLQEMN